MKMNTGQPTATTSTSMECKARPIAVVSHPRSGTHLTIDGLRHFFIETYRRQGFNQSVHELYVNLDRLNREHPYALKRERIEKVLRTCEKRVLIKTHCGIEMEQVEEPERDFARAVIESSDVVCVVRDVRAVMMSYMALRPMRFAESPTQISEFLRTEMDGGSTPAANWARHVSGWIERPGVMVVKFEELREAHEKSILALGQRLGLHWNQYPIRRFSKPRSILENKVRRVLGMQNSSSIDNLRMSIQTRPWREAMSKEDLALIREQAGAVMKRLGYQMS